ncbi:MAG: cupin domain-containing protein, partial [Polyangiales bacterium]
VRDARDLDPEERVDLGVDLEAGQRAQAIVPAHVWQRAWPLGDFTWVSCTVAPGFEFSGFVLAPPDFDPLRDTQDRLR